MLGDVSCHLGFTAIQRKTEAIRVIVCSVSIATDLELL